MGNRVLSDSVEKSSYFSSDTPADVQNELEEEEGTKDLGRLYPFVISGGTNTERFYFKYVTQVTPYKFIVKPEYFGGESNYTEVFSSKISQILERNADAKIFCVFDWDTIDGEAAKLLKHQNFVQKFHEQIEQGSVVICQTMPCIEYWFLLHFKNYTARLKSYSKVSNVLAKYIRPYFPNASGVKLSKLLKKEEYVDNPAWVVQLCADGKLEQAIKRAEENVNDAIDNNKLDKVSYSFVYKLFKE